MIIRFFSTLGEGIKNIWRNRMMSIASIGSITATLVILGIIFALIINISSITNSAKEQFDTIQVYVQEGETTESIKTIGKEILRIGGVNNVRFESNEEALSKMKLSWEDNAYLLEGLESNPLPNSFIIYLNDIAFSENVLSRLSAIEGVEEVKSYQDVIDKLMAFTQLVQRTGLIIIVVLIGISVFIINNTIRIAVNSRKREINIMKYVGATNWYIRWPFLVEGTFLGLIGALLAGGIMKLVYDYAYGILTSKFYVLIAAYVVRPEDLMNTLLFLFVIIGSGIGALGSLMSMRKHLNV